MWEKERQGEQEIERQWKIWREKNNERKKHSHRICYAFVENDIFLIGFCWKCATVIIFRMFLVNLFSYYEGAGWLR